MLSSHWSIPPKKHRLSFCPDISISETMLIYLSGILKNAHLEPRDENNYWDFENKYGNGNSICTLNQKGCFLETVPMVVVLSTLQKIRWKKNRYDEIFREIFVTFCASVNTLLMIFFSCWWSPLWWRWPRRWRWGWRRWSTSGWWSAPVQSC